jgi:hypothetical protein
MGIVTSNKNGVGFTYAHWHRFLKIIRHSAKRYGVKARDVERALFKVHREHQKGTLYGKGVFRVPGCRV